MTTTHRHSVTLAPVRINLDEDDIGALIAVMSSGYLVALEPLASIVTETPSRRIEAHSAKEFLEAIADLRRPLQNLTVTVIFKGGGGQIDTELSRSKATVSANGGSLDWVQRKPAELQNWFKAHALWYGRFGGAVISVFLFILLFSLTMLAFPLFPGPSRAALQHGADASLTQGLVFGFGFAATAIITIWSFSWFPKALITDTPRASARVTDRVQAITAVVLAICAVVTAVFAILTYLHPLVRTAGLHP